MKLSLSKDDLSSYVERLLDAAFPDGERNAVPAIFDAALERTERCFAHIALRGYRDERGGACFDHLHGDQFAIFTYFLSNQAWRDGDARLAQKFSLLNRMRSALLIMPDTQLPEIFVIPHTVGTVIGKAKYENYLVVCQNVTIANDLTTHLAFGSGVILFPGAFVVGKGTIGEGSVIAANATVQYQDIPPYSLVSGRSPDLHVRPRKRDFLARFFVPPYPGCEEKTA